MSNEKEHDFDAEAEALGIYEFKPLSNMWVKKDGTNGSWMLTPDGFKKVSNSPPEHLI